mgnify:FL=1|jgi:hypothetical protein
MTGRLRITGPADLIEAVPYLIGFAPTESTVIVGITGNQVVVAARVDLDDGESAAADVLRQLLAQTERAVMIVYTEQPTPQWVQQPTHLLSEALLVTGGRWYSMLCTDPTCCPPDGRPLPTTPGTVSATAVSLGIAPAPTRQAITASLAPAPAIDEDTRRAHALTPIPARDQAWLALDELASDNAALTSKAAEYLHTARHCPQDERAAAPWFLYAWAQWRLGDGARASIALDYLDAAAPNYSAADLLRYAMQAAVNPRTAPSLADLHQDRDQLRESVAEALDVAHLPWTRDEDSYTVAGCSVGLNYATGRPEVWQVEADADVDRVAEALAGVQVSPRGSAS